MSLSLLRQHQDCSGFACIAPPKEPDLRTSISWPSHLPLGPGTERNPQGEERLDGLGEQDAEL